MTLPDLIALTVALGAWATVYFQARSVRVAEAQLGAQIHSIGDVVKRLEQERLDRERAIALEGAARSGAIKAAMGTEHGKGWADHRAAWDFTTSSHVIQCAYLSRLSLAVSMLVGQQLVKGADPETDRVRLLVINGLAAAVGRFADLDFDYHTYVLDARNKGQEVRSVEEVFGERHKASKRQMENAWEAVSALLKAQNDALKDGGV